MANLNRREFMKHSAGALAATALLPSVAVGAPAAPIAAATRTLGKTGVTASLLGMGTGTRAWNGNSAQNRQGRETFVGTLRHGFARGLRYFDLADMYGSHD